MPLYWEDDETTEFRPQCAPEECYTLRRLSSGDNKAASRASVTMEGSRPRSADTKVRYDLPAFDTTRLLRSIVGWSHTHDGEPVPITAENVERLDPASYAELVAEVDRLNPLAVPETPTSEEGSSPISVASAKRRRKT